MSAHTFASAMLAFRNMRTLYLRNVPDDVAAKLESLAADAGMSLSSFTVRELVDISRRADNAELLGTLPDVGVDNAAILSAVDESRAAR